ncbi:MAG: PEP-CTERM sorting domain-containing protein [Phycisphaerae bacterium]|nr:PEP-CTERM sorting domain-containing protein [Phycisphaerae bacterium]
MRITAVSLAAFAMAIIPSSARAYTFDDVQVTYWAGVEPEEGVSEALMVVDWQIPGKNSLVLGYRWTGEAKGDDMLNAIYSTNSRFYFEWHTTYAGAVYGIGWDVDGDGFEKTDPDDYYAEGWMGNSWRYFLSSDGEDWTYSISGAGNRTLSDGDWDGWSWAPNSNVSVPDNLPPAEITVIPGDSNGDGVVDDVDYDNLMSQFGGTPGADSADFNGDNVVDLEDFAILREHFGFRPVTAPDAEFGAPVPEPVTVLLLGGMAAPFVLRRRRRE